jgi:hypothetical protein
MKRVALPILLAAGLLAPISVNAQGTSSSTPVIGYYKFTAPSGKSIWNCAFMTKKDFQGAATSIAQAAPNSVITQTGAGWTPNAFNTSANPATQSSHFVEILSGPLAGTLADIVSNTADTVTVEGLGIGTSSVTYCIRKHTTVGSIFKTAGLGPFEDEVLLFSDTGATSRYLYDDTAPGHMVDAVDFVTIKDDVVIYPGQAFVLTIGTAKTLTFGGNEVSYVKTGVTKIPIYAGITNLVGLYDPIVAADPLTTTAANERHSIDTIGLQSSGLAPFEDEIALFGISGGSFTRTGLFYYDDTPPGAIVDSVNFSPSTAPIPNGTGFLLKPATVSKIYTQPQFQNP